MLVYPYRIRRENQGREKCSATMNLLGRMHELSVLKVVLVTSDPFRVVWSLSSGQLAGGDTLPRRFWFNGACWTWKARILGIEGVVDRVGGG